MASFDSRLALLGNPVNSVDSYLDGAAFKQQHEINEAAASQARQQRKVAAYSTILNSAPALMNEPDPNKRAAAFERMKAFASQIDPEFSGQIAGLTVEQLPQIVSGLTSWKDQLEAQKTQQQIETERMRTGYVGAQTADIGIDNARADWKTGSDIANNNARTGGYLANINSQIGDRATRTSLYGSDLAADNSRADRLADSTILDRGRRFDVLTDKMAATGYGQVPEGQIIGADGRAAAIPGAVTKATAEANSINFDDETKLRGEYLKQTDEFATIGNAYQNVQAAARTPSAAGDLSLIFAYMKMLDPGSVVREQEFANAQNAAGVPDQIRNLYNRILSGERLNETQRADFTGQAQNLYANAERRAAVVGDEYRRLSGAYGFDPNRIITNRGINGTAATATAPNLPSPADIGASEGDEVEGPDGRTYVVANGRLVVR